MTGIGQQFLPRPNFSPDNPYWIDPDAKWGFLRKANRPKLTAQDFLYASVWEITKRDIHGANCVRIAVQRTVKLNWYFGIARQVKTLLANKKETQSA